MGGLFRYDSKPMQFLSKAGDLMVLNLLLLLCSAPLFTVGAAVSALYTQTFRLRKDETAEGMVKGYFRAFGQNFKKGTLLWLFYAAAGAFLAGDFLLVSLGTVEVGKVWKALIAVVAVLYVFSVTWVFPLQARFENSIRQTVKNSLLLAFTNLKATVPAVLLTVFPWVFLYFKTDWFMRILPVWLLLAFSAIAYGNTILFEKIFDRYAGKTEAAETEPSSTETACAEPAGTMLNDREPAEAGLNDAESAIAEFPTPKNETW